MSPQSDSYVEPPTVPPDMTLGEYRRQRAEHHHPKVSRRVMAWLRHALGS
jgi:hypothetical protein